jgi:hypothetical protein
MFERLALLRAMQVALVLACALFSVGSKKLYDQKLKKIARLNLEDLCFLDASSRTLAFYLANRPLIRCLRWPSFLTAAGAEESLSGRNEAQSVK